MTDDINWNRVGSLLALAGSDADGEALAAIRKLKSTIEAGGLSFTDLGERLKSPARATSFWDDPTTQDIYARARAYAGPEAAAARATAQKRRDDAAKAEAARKKAEAERFWRERAEEQRRKNAKEAARIIKEIYGGDEAAAKRPCERERALIDAVKDLPKKRWGGWRKATDYEGEKWTQVDGVDAITQNDKMPARFRAAVLGAVAISETLAGIRDELEYWQRRDDEVIALFNRCGGGSVISIPAMARRWLMQDMLESEAPANNLDDLRVRIGFGLDSNWIPQTERVLDAVARDLDRLIFNAAAAPPTVRPTAPAHSIIGTAERLRRRAG